MTHDRDLRKPCEAAFDKIAPFEKIVVSERSLFLRHADLPPVGEIVTAHATEMDRDLRYRLSFLKNAGIFFASGQTARRGRWCC